MIFMMVAPCFTVFQYNQVATVDKDAMSELFFRYFHLSDWISTRLYLDAAWMNENFCNLKQLRFFLHLHRSSWPSLWPLWVWS